MMNTESRLRKLRERRKKLEAIADASPANAKEYGEYVDQIYDIEQTLYNRFNKQYDKSKHIKRIIINLDEDMSQDLDPMVIDEDEE